VKLFQPIAVGIIFLAFPYLAQGVLVLSSLTPLAQKATEEQLAAAATETRANLMAATEKYRESLEQLLVLQMAQEERLAAGLQRQRSLFGQGIVSKRELEESERKLAEAQRQVAETRQQIDQANQLMAEVAAAEEAAKQAVAPPGAFYSSLILIRYTGPARWSLAEAAKIESFFAARFGRPLPVSAYGQTPTHSRLGFDHREGLDIALHPESIEGQALVEYLRKQGIPFTAFRAAWPGSATGAHIHIGRPSHRLAGAVP
jgi:hypothetical protein